MEEEIILNENDYESMMGYRYRYYKKQIDTGKSRFNFVAFFFAPFWLAYRKMYGHSIFVLFIWIVTISLNSVYFNMGFNIKARGIGSLINIISLFLVHLFYGLLGNRLYIRKFFKMIKNRTKIHHVSDYDLKRDRLRRWGGVVIAYLIFIYGSGLMSYLSSFLY